MSIGQKVAYSVGFLAVMAAVASAALSAAVRAEATSLVLQPTCSISISPTSIYSGSSATLTWSSQNANLAVINHGIGSVSGSGSQTITNITSSNTYILTVNGPGGSNTCSASIGVLPQQLPTCSISANPTYLTQGNGTTLTWSSSNTQNASINNGVGIVSTNGSQVVYPSQGATNYILTVNGTNGSQTCSTTVTTDYSYTHNQQPYCTMSVSPSYTNYGGSATLTWSAGGSNVYGPYIDNNIGSVALSGSRMVNPYQTTTYNMTVTDRQGRTSSCSAALNVSGNSYVPPTYYPSTYYPQVPLTHIPYTGTADGLYIAFVLAITAAAWSIVGYALYTRREQITSIFRA